MRAEWQAHIDELLETYQGKQAQLKDMMERLETIEATAEAADGLVRVRVDRQGRLAELELDPRVYRKLSSEELSEAVMEAARNAQEQVDEQLSSAMSGLTPEGGPGGFDPSKLLPDLPADMDAVRERYGFLPR